MLFFVIFYNRLFRKIEFQYYVSNDGGKNTVFCSAEILVLCKSIAF
jgi:hypothetical protein